MNPVLRFLIWVDVQVLRLVTLGKSRPGGNNFGSSVVT